MAVRYVRGVLRVGKRFAIEVSVEHATAWLVNEVWNEAAEIMGKKVAEMSQKGQGSLPQRW